MSLISEAVFVGPCFPTSFPNADSPEVPHKVSLASVSSSFKNFESPAKILKYIQDQTTELDIHIEKFEYDRCHRVGRKYRNGGKEFQDVLLKLCFWKSREKNYQNRKTFSFKVPADLTPRRNDILKYAEDEIRDNEVISRNVRFVFANINCNLRICSTSNNFLLLTPNVNFLILSFNWIMRCYVHLNASIIWTMENLVRKFHVIYIINSFISHCPMHFIFNFCMCNVSGQYFIFNFCMCNVSGQYFIFNFCM